MAEKLMASEVLGFVVATLAGVEGLAAEGSHWTNGEVVELLETIREGLSNPEWAQVSVEELLVERANLRRALEASAADGLAATALWGAAVRVMEEQRDSARSIAVRLEQELAEVEKRAGVSL